MCVAATPSLAAADVFSGDQLKGFLDLRAASSDGERSWVNEGFGKTRFNGAGDSFETTGLAHAMLIWRPHLTWSLDGDISLQGDTEAHPGFDAVEAFLSYRAPPSDGWRLSGRLGLMYPPVSLENDGPGWTTTRTITPSAINSWIGEEVKVGGAEVSARHQFGDQQLGLSVGAFGWNDTAGTLLAFRGWTLDDVLAGANGHFKLPERSIPYQETDQPTDRLDHRVGYYGRVEYHAVDRLTLDGFYYDNEGDRVSDRGGQTDWRTRFTDVGMRYAIDGQTLLLAQALTGRTVWGSWTPGGYWVDLNFAAAYVLLSRRAGAHTFTGRIDYFETTDNSYTDLLANNDEEGWATTFDYLYQVNPHIRLGLEFLHIRSDRPTRLDQGLDEVQNQNTLQSSLKLSF
jgi:hypothetical protein